MGGAHAGETLSFVAPTGQNMTTTVQSRIEPGGVLVVACPLETGSQADMQTAPLFLPTSTAPEDSRAATVGWLLFILGWMSCLCVPVGSMLFWGISSLIYYCKPASQRRLRPLQRTPSCFSLVSLILVSVLILVLFMYKVPSPLRG